jgi:hypothetical protein
MKGRKFTSSEALLHDLLDRLEARPGVAHHRSYVDYDAFPNIAAQDRMESDLVTAEKLGVIALTRERHSTEIRMVKLVDAPGLYTHLERMPAAQSMSDALAGLRARPELPALGRAMLDDIVEAWTRNVSRYGIKPGDTEGLAEVIDLTLAVAARSPDAPLTDYRTFSLNAGQHSKALERRLASVAAMLETLFAGKRETGLDASEVMATYGLARIAQPLLMSGPIAMDGAALPRTSYVGIPSEDADRITLSASVAYVLTIENYTSFVRHVREVNTQRKALIFYTGGFPARPILRQIVRLAKLAGTDVLHWGDIDPGGLRIFRHFEHALAANGMTLQPHMMSADLLDHAGVAMKRENGALRHGGAAGSMLSDLWDIIASQKRMLEQESLAPCAPVGVANSS